jgi:hypothetical protein
MQVRCPRCGAIIRFDDASREQPAPVTCWMCDSMVAQDSARGDSAPSTVVAPPSFSHERPGTIGLRGGSASQTASLDLQPGDVVKICVTGGLSKGKEFELSKPLTTIGRLGGGADIELNDPEVSRSHCAVEVRRDAILLHDLRSTNGTYLGYHRVSVVRLEPMSSFRIGSSFLQLRLPKLEDSPKDKDLVR